MSPPPRTLIACEIGRYRLALTSAARAGDRASGTRPFAAGALASLGVATLALAGASAAPRPEAALRYSVSVAVPAPPPRNLARSVRSHAPGRIAKPVTPATPAPAPGPFGAEDAPYVIRAMTTGAFQEWDDDLGQHRFLTAGSARVEGGQTCRNMALLVRLADGGSRVRSAEHCTTGPVSDAPTPATPDGQDE